MKLLTPVSAKLTESKWANDPELCLLDTILEQNPDLYQILKADIMQGNKSSIYGRKDTPSVEQITRAALYGDAQ